MEAIGFNLPGLATQLVNFVILLVLLRMFVYGPVVRMLDNRSEKIRESLAAADQAQEASEKSQEQIQEALQDARAQGQQLIEQARQTSERLVNEAREEARRQGEEETERARAAIERERDDAIDSVRQEFGDLAITAAEKVIQTSLDGDAHKGLIEEVLSEASQSTGRN